MRRRAMAGAILLVLLAACTGGGDERPPGRSVGSPRPPVTTLSRVVLHADLTDRPMRWHRVVSIPFGPRRAELGYVPEGQHTPVAYIPMSFAVASDGTFWILDEVKTRLAHYSAGGRYLGEIGGVRFDPYHPHPRDLATRGLRPVMLEQRNWSLAGVIDIPAREGVLSRTNVRFRGHPVHVSLLLPSAQRLVGAMSGRAVQPDEQPVLKPFGFGEIDVSNLGETRMLPGIPLGDGNFMEPEPIEGSDLEFRLTSHEARSLLRFRILATDGRSRVPAYVGAFVQAPLRHSLVMLVQVAPARPRDIDRFDDGRWLLSVPDDGSEMLWERIPKPTFDDEFQARYLTTGPEDSIYLMQADGHGVSIYRR